MSEASTTTTRHAGIPLGEGGALSEHADRNSAIREALELVPASQAAGVTPPPELVSSPLTDSESKELVALEATIEAGQETFKQVGSALLAIRDRQLYRESHETFAAYVAERWGFTRQWAYRLMESAGVARNLSTMVDIEGLNERQARTLAPLSPDDQLAVYRLAKATAPKGRVTAKHLKGLATVARGVMQTGAIDDGSAWEDASASSKLSLLQTAVDAERQRQQRAQARQALSSSASVQWYTPARYIAVVREVMGEIDLDPASCEQANGTVQAENFYDAEADGLSHDWPGRVFMNPPYCGKAGDFVAHLIDQYQRGITTSAVVLVSANSTDTQWFRPLFDYPICFAGRISFASPSGTRTGATFGSAFAYLGDDIAGFVKVFQRFGPVVRRIDNA